MYITLYILGLHWLLSAVISSFDALVGAVRIGKSTLFLIIYIEDTKSTDIHEPLLLTLVHVAQLAASVLGEYV